jgi:MYND finger
LFTTIEKNKKIIIKMASKLCSVCDEYSATYRCSDCGIKEYCSKKCQIKDWNERKHSEVCSEMKMIGLSVTTLKEEFFAKMRMLWDEHTKYTALFIVAALDGNTAAVKWITPRLAAENQRDIGEAVTLMILSRSDGGDGGDSANNARKFGEELTRLLTQHISQAGEIVTDLAATREKDVLPLSGGIKIAGLNYLNELKRSKHALSSLDFKVLKWYENAEEIANFIVNSEFVQVPKQGLLEKVREGLFTHLDQTLLEALAYNNKDYPVWIEYIDEASHHMLEFSDAMTTIFIGKE